MTMMMCKTRQEPRKGVSDDILSHYSRCLEIRRDARTSGKGAAAIETFSRCGGLCELLRFVSIAYNPHSS
jgi:hypothetical protein